MLIVTDHADSARPATSSGIATPSHGLGMIHAAMAMMASSSVNAPNPVSEGIRSRAAARTTNERASVAKNPTETMMCNW